MVADCTEEEKTRTVTKPDGKVVEIYVPDIISDEQLFENKISAGINFQEYYDIPVEVKGENMLASIKSFEASGLCLLILDNIKKSEYE